MDIAVNVSLVWLFINAVIVTSMGPFAIGQLRGPYNGGNYLGDLSRVVALVIVAGRIWGWW